MTWWLLTLPTAITLHFLICLFLFKRERVPQSVLSKHYIEELPKKFPTMESVKQYERQLETNPSNFELRMEILLARMFVHFVFDKESAEHGFWFLENMPLHDFTSHEAGSAILVTAETGKNRSVEAWQRHIKQSGDNPFYIRAAAQHLSIIDHKISMEYLKKLLSTAPFSTDILYNLAKLEAWELPRGALAKHPVPELKASLQYLKKQMSLPWSEYDSSRVQQLRWKYKPFFPIWFCNLFLRLISRMGCSENPWNNHYLLSNFGMTAYHFGDYATAKKCVEQFLEIQPAAQKDHDYPPIFSKGFSLAAILSFRDGDMEQFNHYMNYKATIPTNSEYSISFDDSEILTFLSLVNRADISINFLKQRTKYMEPVPQEIEDLISYIQSGGIPYSENYFKWITELSKRRTNTS